MLHIPLLVMNRLNETESAIFVSLVYILLPKDLITQSLLTQKALTQDKPFHRPSRFVG